MPDSIGQQLKKARTEHHITLEQAAQVTHIRVLYLEALENDQRSRLPSEVQGRGFLRLYADYLSIPVQPLLDTWEGKAPVYEKPPEIPSPDSSGPSDHPETAEVIFSPTAPQEEKEEFDHVVSVPETPSQNIEIPKTESQRIFTEIGSTIRKQREALGISINDVESHTHLRLRYLQALEAGHMEDLPSLVQARGMLNNYCHFLELDTEAILLRFAEALQSRRIEIAPPPPKPGLLPRKRVANAPAWRRFITPDLLIGGAVILFLFGFALWGASQISDLRGQQKAATAPPISEVLLKTPSPNPVITEALFSAVQPQQTEDESSINPNEATPEALPSEVLPMLGNAPFQLYIVAHQRAWMQVKTDNKIAFTGRVAPGSDYTYSANKQIELTTGNAAALEVYFNQNNLGSLGLTGQVVSLVFNKDGILTPTASFSPTPTNTQPATATALPSPTLPKFTITPLIP
jgi:cytoskeleton protein RodZ